jgi:hypothetical protein
MVKANVNYIVTTLDNGILDCPIMVKFYIITIT